MQRVNCCLKYIEWLLSGTNMPLNFKMMIAINRNRILLDFMLRMFNHLTQLIVNEKSLLIDKISKYQSRDESAKEFENPNRYNKTRH